MEVNRMVYFVWFTSVLIFKNFFVAITTVYMRFLRHYGGGGGVSVRFSDSFVTSICFFSICLHGRSCPSKSWCEWMVIVILLPFEL